MEEDLAMSLLDAFKKRCTLLEKHRAPDGEGGFVTTWTDGPTFEAAVVYDRSLQAQVAQKQGVTSLYSVTVEKNVTLEFHDVFRRNEDGQLFRVTTDAKDAQTPGVASFSFAQVKAEEWRLPG